MPYTIRKSKCRQSSGKKGSYTLSFVDKNGEKHRHCHTSKKKLYAQIGRIEGPKNEEVEDIERKGQQITQEVSESYDVDPGDIFFEGIMIMVMEELIESRSQT